MRWLNARAHPRVGERRRLTAGVLRGHPWVMVWTLAVAQVISWGSLYYTFSLFVVPMQESLGWSRPLLNGALSLGLLATGVVAFPVGAWIDRRGGRTAMTLVGGFASTVFMPLTQLLIATVGWRQALLVLGGLNLAVCLPLHALFVPARPAPPPPTAP